MTGTGCHSDVERVTVARSGKETHRRQKADPPVVCSKTDAWVGAAKLYPY